MLATNDSSMEESEPAVLAALRFFMLSQRSRHKRIFYMKLANEDRKLFFLFF